MALNRSDISERTDVRYRRNLAALAKWQPEVAEVVDATPVPGTVTPATGRDGSPTYLIGTEDGGFTWFGQSSMPSISADALFSESYHGSRSTAGGDGNVLLSGVFTGREPLVIAERLPPYAALFVIESDPLNLKLAMHLHAYGELVQAGQLVFALGTGDAVVDGLRTLFERHPGYEWPSHMLTVPQLLPPTFADLQHQLAQAADVVAGVHARVTESCTRSLQARKLGVLPQRPRVALLSRDPRPVSLEQAQRVGRALSTLGLPHEVCVPDTPDKCHRVARIAAIDESKADLVFMVNSAPGAMGSLLPDALPVVAWYGPEAVVSQWDEPVRCESYVAFAASRRIRDALITGGVPGHSVHMCGPAADETAFRPPTPSHEGPDVSDIDVAVFMDVPDDRPEACGIDLASHVALWQALQEAVTQRADAYQVDLVEDLLEEGQRRSGTTMRDAKVQARFLTLIRTRLAPAALAKVAVKALLTNGYRVGLWGHHWAVLECDRDLRRGPIPTADALTRVLSAARVAVFPGPSTTLVQTAVDALASGTPVVCRRPDEPFEQEYPDLADLAPFMNFYTRSEHLLNTVRAGLASPPQVVERHDGALRAADAGRSLVLNHHTTGHRVRFIIETVRGGVKLAEQGVCGQS